MNIVAIVLGIWNGMNFLTICVVLILIINCVFAVYQLLELRKHSSDKEKMAETIPKKSSFEQDRINRYTRNVEYSNNLLKLMYRQDDIQKAINFIGNEFNILKYNYFFIADVELVSIITDDIIPIDNAQSLIAIVYQNGLDKFFDVNSKPHKIESALGQKSITYLYYIVLIKDEKKYGIAELGFSNALEAEVLENLKMCLNELTKF